VTTQLLLIATAAAVVTIISIIIILRKNLEAIPGKHSIDSLRNTAILGTSHNTESTAV
jgi:hypothetical protein